MAKMMTVEKYIYIYINKNARDYRTNSNGKRRRRRANENVKYQRELLLYNTGRRGLYVFSRSRGNEYRRGRLINFTVTDRVGRISINVFKINEHPKRVRCVLSKKPSRVLLVICDKLDRVIYYLFRIISYFQKSVFRIIVIHLHARAVITVLCYLFQIIRVHQ